MTRFIAKRYDTPHAVVDLREVDGNINWRVKAEVLEITPPRSARPPARRTDYEGALCAACGQRKARKGGANRAHRFVCANCK